MTHVVTESCIACRFTDCVSVCPVNCFKGGGNFLVIDPDECIDCGVCIPECPVEAIYADTDLPDDQKHFLELNRTLAASWPTISEKEAPLATAESHRRQKDKLALLEE
jgi:ferredoxin